VENLHSHFADSLESACGHPISVEELLTQWKDLKQIVHNK